MNEFTTRRHLRGEVAALYSEMIGYYMRFSIPGGPGGTDMQRMKRNLDSLLPASTEEHMEAIRFLDYFLAVHLGQDNPSDESERLQLLNRAGRIIGKDSRKRRALRKWRRVPEESDEQAV